MSPKSQALSARVQGTTTPAAPVATALASPAVAKPKTYHIRGKNLPLMKAWVPGSTARPRKV